MNLRVLLASAEIVSALAVTATLIARIISARQNTASKKALVVDSPAAAKSKPLDIFLPRSASAFVFTLAVTCYDLAITLFCSVIVYILHLPPRPPSFWESHGDPAAHIIEALWFAPVLESCVLVGLVELQRLMKAPTVVQVFLSAVILAGPHSYTWGWEPYAFIVAPSFAIQSASYIYWRAVSRTRGLIVVVSIHALHNLMPAMLIIEHATRKA
jgi:hypothetical protein